MPSILASRVALLPSLNPLRDLSSKISEFGKDQIKKKFWLPPDFRTSHVAASGNLLALGLGSGSFFFPIELGDF